MHTIKCIKNLIDVLGKHVFVKSLKQDVISFVMNLNVFWFGCII